MDDNRQAGRWKCLVFQSIYNYHDHKNLQLEHAIQELLGADQAVLQVLELMRETQLQLVAQTMTACYHTHLAETMSLAYQSRETCQSKTLAYPPNRILTLVVHRFDISLGILNFLHHYLSCGWMLMSALS